MPPILAGVSLECRSGECWLAMGEAWRCRRLASTSTGLQEDLRLMLIVMGSEAWRAISSGRHMPWVPFRDSRDSRAGA